MFLNHVSIQASYIPRNIAPPTQQLSFQSIPHQHHQGQQKRLDRYGHIQRASIDTCNRETLITLQSNNLYSYI